MQNEIAQQDDIAKAVEVLRSGGVVAHATDTCYGFSCDAFNEDALKRLFAVKQMPMNKPISIMVASLEEAKKYGEFTGLALELAQQHWPGALTIIVPRKDLVPRFLNPTVNSIGIRVANHELSLELVKRFGSPITTTSANVSGEMSPHSVDEINAQFAAQPLKPDFIIDSGEIEKNPPSTIVDCTRSECTIVRQGELRLEY
ncbi:threonylcarbamoyl-AMP synthase [Candidatus Peregrinibacteria bacterium CG11_big_fil_rev_8_21_14_0_20_46_8]|nr:MAG: threonylcarbamoyl-AMP synthase [Candidatus Peregrinibacteria bacterium CG11_big_fil_rev_8_21_14_0_20_46_8]